MESDLERLAYAVWRWDVWMKNIGSYEEIEWATSRYLLRPMKMPGIVRTWLVRKLIQKRRERFSATA